MTGAIRQMGSKLSYVLHTAIGIPNSIQNSNNSVPGGLRDLDLYQWELGSVLGGFADFCPLEELRQNTCMIPWPIMDGRDVGASEIAEKARNHGSKKSHSSWSIKT